MAPWTSCNLEEEILTILESDSPATLRHLCALIYPLLSWTIAQRQDADIVRHHCRFLVQQRLIRELDEDEFTMPQSGRA